MTLHVPDGLRFCALNLSRDPAGGIAFDVEPIERICAANGIDPRTVMEAHEDAAAELLTAWYRAAILAGEPRDAVADELIDEARSELN